MGRWKEEMGSSGVDVRGVRYDVVTELRWVVVINSPFFFYPHFYPRFYPFLPAAKNANKKKPGKFTRG